MDEYFAPKNSAESELSEKKSVFLGHLRPVTDEEEAKAFIAEMKKKYADARHNVWAYRLPDGVFRSSDDGEPSGTGGAPVLDAITKRGLAGCVIVVTRYFGGILLGTGGLVRAYSGAASLALDAAGVLRMTPYLSISFSCSYGLYGSASRLCEKYSCRGFTADFGEEVAVSLLLPPAKSDAFDRDLRDLSCGAVTSKKGEIRCLAEE